MDFGTVLTFLQGVLPAAAFSVLHYVLLGLGALVVLGLAVVKLTPSQADDEAANKLLEIPVLGALLKFLMAFSPIQPK